MNYPYYPRQITETLLPGPELDDTIAEFVFERKPSGACHPTTGRKLYYWGPTTNRELIYPGLSGFRPAPPFSTSPEHAWFLADELVRLGIDVGTFRSSIGNVVNVWFQDLSCTSDAEFPLAMCRVALEMLSYIRDERSEKI